MTRAATTPQERRSADKEAKAAERQRRADWAAVVADRGARRAIRGYLTRCWAYGSCPSGDLQAQGIRDAALTLMNTLRTCCPQALLLMETEAEEDREAAQATPAEKAPDDEA